MESESCSQTCLLSVCVPILVCQDPFIYFLFVQIILDSHPFTTDLVVTDPLHFPLAGYTSLSIFSEGQFSLDVRSGQADPSSGSHFILILLAAPWPSVFPLKASCLYPLQWLPRLLSLVFQKFDYEQFIVYSCS